MQGHYKQSSKRQRAINSLKLQFEIIIIYYSEDRQLIVQQQWRSEMSLQV